MLRTMRETVGESSAAWKSRARISKDVAPDTSVNRFA